MNALRRIPAQFLPNLAVIFGITALLIAASLYWLLPVLNQAQQTVVSLQYSAALHTIDTLELFFDAAFVNLFHFGMHAITASHNEETADIDILFGARSDFLSLFVFDASGELVAFSAKKESEPPILPGRTTQDAVFFQEALKDKRYISPVFFGPSGPILQIASPLKEDGRIVGAALGEMDFSLLWQVVNKLSVEHGKAYLVNEGGTIIADPNPVRARSGESLLYRQVVRLLAGGQERVDSSRYLNEKGEKVLALGLRVPDIGWGVIIEQLESEALKQRNQTLFVALVFSGASFILIILLVVGTVRLVRAMTALEKSKAALEIQTKELQEARTGLEKQVAARTKELKDLAQRQEETIQERTKELQDKIDELEKFYRLTVGRELTMVELKREIKQLKRELDKNKPDA